MCQFGVPNLLFVTHVPALLLSLTIGFIVLFSDRKNNANRYLFLSTMFLCLWIISDIGGWEFFDPRINLFFTRLALLTSVSILPFFCFIVEFTGRSISRLKKIILSIPFLPIILLLFTDYNAYIYDQNTCSASYGPLIKYVFIVSILFLSISIGVLKNFYNERKGHDDKTVKQIKLIAASLTFVVLWFFSVVLLVNFSSSDYFYMLTPAGIVIFVSILAYSMVRYQLLDIKLIAAQALTYSIWLLIGSEYFLTNSLDSYLLTTLILIFSIIFGIFLIKSVKFEVQRKEQLQNMADSLAIANDQLRKLDNAKTEFISIASHQLRTPITAIKGFVSLILEGSYGDIGTDAKGALEKVFVSTERLVELIEDLLNVSRIESGRMTFTFEKANIEKILKELYENFVLVAKNKKFYLDLKLPEAPLPEIVMDQFKVRELISNFIDNALKYTEKGGVTIKAEILDNGVVVNENGFVIFGKKSEFGKVVRITVSDTGIGVARDDIPYLFKKFSRGKDVSRLHVGGTGLGLYVGKAITQAHHGQVWVESDGQGLGSRFIIEIPIEHVE